MNKIILNCTINGKAISRETVPNQRLLDFLREEMGLTSVKEGCGEGECGACTIIFNGDAVTSCCMLVGQAEGSTIVTLEGLSHNGEMDKVQKAFIQAGAVQCGFCTPGMVLTAKALLDKNPHPTQEEIRQAMAGNLCRCTGYAKIHRAVELAAES